MEFRQLPHRFPWRAGNRFALLVDGPQFFPPMLEAIMQARETVLLEVYLFESGAVADRFIDALSAAVQRGVSVYLLLDDFGCLALSRRDRQRLRDAGVHVTFYNPLRFTGVRHNLFRNHRKLLLVDGAVAFVGGMGLTDAFAPADGEPWHDTAVRIEGPVVADWHLSFVRTWNLWSRHALTLPIPPTKRAGMQVGRLALSAGLQRTEIKGALLKRVRAAERRVWIATAYFIPARRLRRALRQAARAGVDVRLLLTGPQTDHPAVRHAGRRFYGQLLRAGVRIFEYQPRFLHAKVQLCDNWVSIGSSNVDRWNFRWNLEANQEVADAGFAAEVQAFFERDFAASQEIVLADWAKRSRWARLQERAWGALDLWMERRSQPRR
ncbi:MAG: phosphatidylserine/phosphatidylglycerophosphate/cardiolipin synthase family protein [Thiohalomonadaceae bacterium]